MKMNQRKAGVMLSYISEAVKILSGLVYTPIMLRLLGQSEYGLYQLVYSVVSYLSLLSLGFGSSYMRFYSRYKAKNDQNGVARLNGMFMIIFALIALICCICGVVMLGNVHAIFGDGLIESEIKTAQILMALMIVNLAITFLGTVFNCIITAHERFFFQKILIVAQSILNPFLTLPLLILGYGSVGMVVVTTFLTIVTFVSNVFYCIKKIKVKFLFKGLQFSLLKEMWVFTFFIFLNQIIDQINWSVGKFLLGRFTGTVAVAIYGVGAQINSMYLMFSTSVSNVFIPKVNRIVAESDDNHELTELFTKIGRIQFIIMALVLSGFVFFGRPFIYFWAGNEYTESYIVTLLLITPVTVPLIQNLGIEIQRAKNKHSARSIVYFFIALINVIVSIPLIKKFGPTGAAIGTAMSLSIGNILFMNWYYHNKIGLNMIYFWKKIVSFVPALVIPCIIGIICVKFISFDSVIKLALGICTYVVVYGISMWFLGFNKEEKQLILPIVNKILRR